MSWKMDDEIRGCAFAQNEQLEYPTISPWFLIRVYVIPKRDVLPQHFESEMPPAVLSVRVAASFP